MTRGIFVAGTDTGVGKTVVAVALLRSLVAGGLRAAGMKPVAAGIDPGAAMNADVRALIDAANVPARQSDVNPYSLALPIAPHLAAKAAGLELDLDRIAAAYARLALAADAVVVEGAGGVLVPLGSRTDMLDVPARLGLPVLLVVGMRLGCLNHAFLSAMAIAARGLRLAGWVANRIDPAMAASEGTLDALRERLPAPLVADIGWCEPGGGVVELEAPALQALNLVPGADATERRGAMGAGVGRLPSP